MGLGGGGERKVVAGFILVARKHAKAARGNKQLLIAGKVAFRGEHFTEMETLPVSSNVSRPENGL